jgi:Mrp family chromosome partitioning ATPase
MAAHLAGSGLTDSGFTDSGHVHGNGHSDSPSNGHGHCATAVAEDISLAAWLAGDSSDVEGLLKPTQLPNVDQLLACDDRLPREAWGTQRVTDLLAELRERYTLVLISGPTVEQAVDLQMLAARVDGIVLSAPARSVVGPKANAVVRDLSHLQAPILGLIA